jgi:choline dehydrogenase-like flavoprotein
MRRVVESDVCIVGSGITAAMVAEKLSGERDLTITVVEAGDDVPDLQARTELRRKYLAYGDTPWPNDHLDGFDVEGIQSRSMNVGGLAMHWGGVTPRFSPEDFRVKSLYGVGDDWPISYEQLDPYYQEAEVRMGVAGEQGPPNLDPRGEPYPLPPLPLSYNLEQIKTWGTNAGIPFWSQPSAKNSKPYGGRPECCRNDTCFPVCPIGAKYSPDMTWNTLRSGGSVNLITRTIVRRIVKATDSTSIDHVVGIDRDSGEEIEFRARTFVIAAGYTWSSHLLLISDIANSSGLVGKYITGHRNVFAFAKLPFKLYAGLNSSHTLVTKQFMRPGPLDKYVRHDLRLFEATVGSEPRLRDDDGNILLGDDMLSDWQRRAERGSVRIRSYYDVLPDRSSEITLDGNRTTPLGDPLPKIDFQDSAASRDLREHTEDTIRARFDDLVAAGNGEIVRSGVSDFQDHPGGGCRMGSDPATSVCDDWGRTHDHENLFVVGAPNMVTGGCANGTLTFCALSLRSAEAIGGV